MVRKNTEARWVGYPLDRGRWKARAGVAVRPRELSALPYVSPWVAAQGQWAGAFSRGGIWATLTPTNNKCLITLGFYSLHYQSCKPFTPHSHHQGRLPWEWGQTEGGTEQRAPMGAHGHSAWS